MGNDLVDIEAAKAEAKRRFDEAVTVVSQLIGQSVIAGHALPAIIQTLEDQRNKIAKDAVLNSTRLDLNPVVWVLDDGIKNLRAMLTE